MFYKYIIKIFSEADANEEILYFENFNLETIVTPVNADRLEQLLTETNYNPTEIKFLVNGFRHGFSLGYQGRTNVKMKSRNLKFRGIGNETTLWNKVMKEVGAKRYAGPFEEPPFENFIQSPIGLVPKDGGKETRLIFHLSYPRGTGTSVNANTPKELCSVKYPEFSEAIRLCMAEGNSCHISRSDMKSAFRNLGIAKRYWKYLLMKAKSPLDGRFYYFVDKCLPFGASISCAHFQRFSNSVAHIVKTKSKKDLVNYLDDYLFAALLKFCCNQQVQLFMDVCSEISFPVNLDKTFWGSTYLVFLGFLIDTVNERVSIPVEKIEKALNLISIVLNNPSGKITLLQLQKICGFLNFIGRCIIPGRAFTRRLYHYTANDKLKPHHHIKVNEEMREDLRIWHKFLQHPSAFSRPFADFTIELLATELNFYTDASGGIGLGGICQRDWMYGFWPKDFLKMAKPSIQYLELFAVLAAVLSWISRFQNLRIVIFCDNESVVNMINFTTTSCKNCMVLLRILVLHSLVNNVRIFAKHVASKDNCFADALSRGQLNRFRRIAKRKFNKTPTMIPELIWPIHKIWKFY